MKEDKPQALARMEPQEVAEYNPSDPQSIIRFAIEKGANVDTIERLMAVRRELQAEHAKKEFDDALAAFQAACPIIKKTKAVADKGGGVRYHFAPLDSIVTQVRDLLKEHGFSYSLTAKVENNWVESICKLTHRGGHFQTSEFKVPIDPKAFMSEAQKFASSLSYSKRYAFVGALGILTSDDDIDANTTPNRPASPSRATEKTREWMLSQLADIRERAHAYAIDKGIIMPDEPLEVWPLESVPTSKMTLDALRKKIEAHQ